MTFCLGVAIVSKIYDGTQNKNGDARNSLIASNKRYKNICISWFMFKNSIRSTFVEFSYREKGKCHVLDNIHWNSVSYIMICKWGTDNMVINISIFKCSEYVEFSMWRGKMLILKLNHNFFQRPIQFLCQLSKL